MVATIAGMLPSWPWLVVAGALLVSAAMLWYAISLGAQVRAAIAPRFAFTVRAYMMAACLLPASRLERNGFTAEQLDRVKQIHRILYRKFSTLLGGRNTIEHHDAFVDLCASGDGAAAAASSGQHWERLGGHITELFATNQLG